MKKVYCDSCGKLISTIDPATQHVFIRHITLDSPSEEDPYRSEFKEFDVCKDCFKKIEDILNVE